MDSSKWFDGGMNGWMNERKPRVMSQEGYEVESCEVKRKYEFIQRIVSTPTIGHSVLSMISLLSALYENWLNIPQNILECSLQVRESKEGNSVCFKVRAT